MNKWSYISQSITPTYIISCTKLQYVWYGMEAFLYTEGIQLTAAHSGDRCTDLTQEEVQQLWRYNL